MTAIASIDEWGDNPVRPPAGELPEPLLQRFLAQAARQGKEIERLKAENEALRGEVEGLTYAYDSLKSDADAVVGGLREKLDSPAGFCSCVLIPKLRVGQYLVACQTCGRLRYVDSVPATAIKVDL